MYSSESVGVMMQHAGAQTAEQYVHAVKDFCRSDPACDFSCLYALRDSFLLLYC